MAQAVAVDGAGLVLVAGSNGFVAALAPFAAQTMEVAWMQNAFGGGVTSRISPAEVIAIYGPGIGPATAVTATPANGFYATTLGGVEVTIGGVAAPLLYVSANQINAVVPMEAVPGAAAAIRVTNAAASAELPAWIIYDSPAAFPTVLNQDGTINSQTNPAKGGSIVTFYATGWQSSFLGLADGEIATSAMDVCQGECSASSATAVPYGGAAPGIVAGVTQFNVQVVANRPASLYQVSLGTASGAGAPAISTPVVTVDVWIAL